MRGGHINADETPSFWVGDTEEMRTTWTVYVDHRDTTILELQRNVVELKGGSFESIYCSD